MPTACIALSIAWLKSVVQNHSISITTALSCVKSAHREPASVPHHGGGAPASRSSMSSIPADILIRSSGSPLAARTYGT